jgi:hypothetical protein
LRTESGDLLPQLHHARSAFGLIVGERHIRIAQEAQHIVPVLLEAHEQIVADAFRLVVAALSATERGFGLVEGEALRDDGLVASWDALYETRSCVKCLSDGIV